MADKAKILVVDDELPVCKSITSALADEAYIVEMALSAEEAIKKEDETEYDVVVTDLMMPGLSGMDLLKTLRQKRPDAKVIMITGYPSIKSAVQSIKLGAFDYIPKPFTPAELRSLVSRALESKRYHEQQAGEEKHEKAPERTLPEGLYTIPENSWALVEDDGRVRVGVHDVFLQTIDAVASVDLPRRDEMRHQGEACTTITDSNARVHKIWAPVGGKVVSINEALTGDYSRLVSDPYGEGWLIVLEPSNLEADLKNLVPLETA